MIMYYINVNNVLIIENILWIREITQLYFIYLLPLLSNKRTKLLMLNY